MHRHNTQKYIFHLDEVWSWTDGTGMSVFTIWTKPLRGGRLRVFGGGFFVQVKVSSAQTTTDDDIRTMLKVCLQGKLPSWRDLGDEMAKRPLKIHTIYL